MLLNLSNHPCNRWTTQQLKSAHAIYGEVKDMSFPNIPPELVGIELDELVETYASKIKAENPQAVHVMGEMTFTYRLVNHLKANDILCIASTTNRIVEEKDGKKIVQFQFVQFRAY